MPACRGSRRGGIPAQFGRRDGVVMYDVSRKVSSDIGAWPGWRLWRGAAGVTHGECIRLRVAEEWAEAAAIEVFRLIPRRFGLLRVQWVDILSLLGEWHHGAWVPDGQLGAPTATRVALPVSSSKSPPTVGGAGERRTAGQAGSFSSLSSLPLPDARLLMCAFGMVAIRTGRRHDELELPSGKLEQPTAANRRRGNTSSKRVRGLICGRRLPLEAWTALKPHASCSGLPSPCHRAAIRRITGAA